MAKSIKHEQLGWAFYFKEASLSPSAEIEAIADKCKLFRPPTMVFADHECTIKNLQTGFQIAFTAEEALKFINHEHRKSNFVGLQELEKLNSISYIPDRLFIKHAEKWKHLAAPKDIEICEIEESSDSFFITPFKGHVSSQSAKTAIKIERTKENVIPVHKLGPENKIVFYHQGELYADELDDNGLIQYDYKFRSMEKSWFGLIRCYARVDDVTIMILDTRIYWEEGWSKVARQFMVKKNTYEEVKLKGFEIKSGWTMDPNQSHHVYQHLDECLVENEYIHFSKQE